MGNQSRFLGLRRSRGRCTNRVGQYGALRLGGASDAVLNLRWESCCVPRTTLAGAAQSWVSRSTMLDALSMKLWRSSSGVNCNTPPLTTLEHDMTSLCAPACQFTLPSAFSGSEMPTRPPHRAAMAAQRSIHKNYEDPFNDTATDETEQHSDQQQAVSCRRPRYHLSDERRRRRGECHLYKTGNLRD
jgi:hypothetical protein